MKLLSDIEGKTTRDNKFQGFVFKETLITYDSPLLLVANSPDGDSWLFKWCDSVEEPSHIERWIAFEVSEPRLASLKKDFISLREAITLPEGEFCIYDAQSLFEPIAIRMSSPEKLPTDYLPSDDVSVSGNLLRLKMQDEERLVVRLHVFSKYIEEGKAPLSIISPIQDNFQQYMTWAAHIINKSPKGRVPSPLIDWSTFSLASVAAGSFKLECISNSNREQSEKLSTACELLSELSNGSLDDIERIKKQFGNDIIYFASLLARFLSDLDISMSISWASLRMPNGYLAIDKRRADNFLKALEPLKKEARAITIRLTDEEAEPIRRRVVGEGGMQSLLRELKRKLTKSNTITLTTDEIERILRYGMDYGQGGFQDRLVGIARALKRVGAAFLTSSHPSDSRRRILTSK